MMISGAEDVPHELTSWQLHLVPHAQLSHLNTIEVPVNTSLLQHLDQDAGKTFYFLLKAFNRADLHTTVKSPSFQVHSHHVPSTGVVLHVADANSSDVIGWQEATDVICARWFGFEHFREEVVFKMAVGSRPMLSDVSGFEETNSSSHHCVEDLTLTPLRKYYVTILASNTQGEARASTHGVFVAETEQVLNESRINLDILQSLVFV